jgi:hypothetical protein
MAASICSPFAWAVINVDDVKCMSIDAEDRLGRQNRQSASLKLVFSAEMALHPIHNMAMHSQWYK